MMSPQYFGLSMSSFKFFAFLDVVVTVAVSVLFESHDPNFDQLGIQTHPTQNMIATGSIDFNFGIKIWVDPGQRSTWTLYKESLTITDVHWVFFGQISKHSTPWQNGPLVIVWQGALWCMCLCSLFNEFFRSCSHRYRYSRIWNTCDGQCLKTLAEGHNAIRYVFTYIYVCVWLFHSMDCG